MPGMSLRRLTGGRPRLVADEGEVEGGFVEGAVEQCRFVCVLRKEAAITSCRNHKLKQHLPDVAEDMAQKRLVHKLKSIQTAQNILRDEDWPCEPVFC